MISIGLANKLIKTEDIDGSIDKLNNLINFKRKYCKYERRYDSILDTKNTEKNDDGFYYFVSKYYKIYDKHSSQILYDNVDIMKVNRLTALLNEEDDYYLLSVIDFLTKK